MFFTTCTRCGYGWVFDKGATWQCKRCGRTYNTLEVLFGPWESKSKPDASKRIDCWQDGYIARLNGDKIAENPHLRTGGKMSDAYCAWEDGWRQANADM